MAIGLFVTHLNPLREDRHIAVASDAVFIQHWKPLAAALKLHWVSRFPTGWLIGIDDIPSLLKELTTLRRHVVETQPDADITTHLLARASRLSRELTEVLNTPDARAFLGPVGLPLLRRSNPMPLMVWTSSVTSAISEPTSYLR